MSISDTSELRVEPLLPLILDISGGDEPPRPLAVYPGAPCLWYARATVVAGARCTAGLHALLAYAQSRQCHRRARPPCLATGRVGS